MPGVDWIPGVSHLKATLQAVTGDTEGAKTTLKNFCRECPGVSQVTSLVQLAAGDVEGAKETQKHCLSTLNNVANGIPVVGHAKGIVHHALGDHEGGNQALNSATRSAVVIGSGAAAAVATGGVGAIPAGIVAGISYDATATVITNEEQGNIAALKNAIDNPSAGSIFDACAIPVGDAMAGYSGGKLVAKKVAINKLDALREVKLAEMEALSEQPGTGGASLKLGYEINALTSEINAIEHGTPVFWDDVKSGETAPRASSSSATLTSATGYINENKERESAPTGSSTRGLSETVISQQEDALYYDSYVDATVSGDNKQEKKKILQKLAEQALLKKISDAYRGVMFTTSEFLKALLQRLNSKDPNRNPDQNPKNVRECENQLIRYSWLRLNMPEIFSYTGIVQLNSAIQGLYHSFIRHVDEWREVIPIDGTLIQRLSPLIKEITKLASAQNAAETDTARTEFLAARQRLSVQQYYDIQTALVEIQMSMHRYIQTNITLNNFLGRSVNANGHEQLLFKVKNRSGRDVVMCVCMSNEQFTSEEENGQPLRIIVTVFFMSWERFKRRGVVETREEMQKKNNK